MNLVVLGTGLLAMAALVAVAIAIQSSGSAQELLRTPVRNGGRLQEMQARWLSEARAARVAGRARQARTLAAQRRVKVKAARKLAKLALVSQMAPGSPAAERAAEEEGREFNAWTTSWHQKHPGASLAKEQAAWHARQGELNRIAAWETRQERRENVKVEETGGSTPGGSSSAGSEAEPLVGADSSGDLKEQRATIRSVSSVESVTGGTHEKDVGTDRNPTEQRTEARVKADPDAAEAQGGHRASEGEDTPALREARVEDEMERGIMDNVAEEEEEGEEAAAPTPQERIARARRLISESYGSGSDPLAARADYLEHRAYWSHARAHMDEEPCTPATFWYEGSIDPRPRCIKPAPSLGYETPEALPPPPAAEPLQGQEQAGRIAEPTVLGVPDGPPDFNGADAVIAHHPFMGWQPTDLEERGGETRGSFSVVSAPSGFDDEGEVQLAIYGPPKTPIGCKIRGYRKLSGDFQGNVISTGFLQKWTNPDGEIQTGPISPGVANEYDILTCRDQENGEVQHFRLSWGSAGFNDMKGHGPVRVLGPHTGMNTDSVTFDMDRPTFEDQRAIDDYYALNYDPATDDKPFSSGRLE